MQLCGERYLSAKEVADMLELKTATVMTWCRNGQLRATKPGKSYLIKESDLKAFVDGNGGKPVKKRA